MKRILTFVLMIGFAGMVSVMAQDAAPKTTPSETVKKEAKACCKGLSKEACEQRKAECKKDGKACCEKKAACKKDKTACDKKKAECRKDKAACDMKKAECAGDKKKADCKKDCDKPCCKDKKMKGEKAKACPPDCRKPCCKKS